MLARREIMQLCVCGAKLVCCAAAAKCILTASSYDAC